jgi:hypothetical protein
MNEVDFVDAVGAVEAITLRNDQVLTSYNLYYVKSDEVGAVGQGGRSLTR